jgi:catechol 2,3-dioxygenase-like lactoylglutathione lyase family enzyme
MSKPDHRRAFLKRVLTAGAALSVPGALEPRAAHAARPAPTPVHGDGAPADPARQASGIGPLDHVAVPMQNVDAMIAFYRALGFVVRDGAQIVSVHFADQKINFHRPALWQRETFTLRAAAARPPCGDFCWVWNGSEESLRATLTRADAEIETEGQRDGGRDGGNAVGQSVYTRDPDGNLLEFIRYA